MSNGSSALLVSCSYAALGEPRALACNRQIILVWYLVDLSSGESPNQGVCAERGRDLRRPRGRDGDLVADRSSRRGRMMS